MKDLRALARDVALETGAVMTCPVHPDILLSSERADVQGAAWQLLCERASAEGLTGDVDLELQPALIFILQSAEEVCPLCAGIPP